MAIFRYPYTDLHEINLDWFLNKFKSLETAFTNLKNSISAMPDATDAEAGQVPTADGDGSWIWADQTGGTAVTVDSAMSSSSTNPVQNKVIYSALADKADADITRTNTTTSVSPSAGGSFTAIDAVTTNSDGQVTGVRTKTITLPSGGGGSVTVDSAMSSSSTNPVQNKVIYEALADKANKYYQYTDIFYNDETGYLVFKNASGTEVITIPLVDYFALASVTRSDSVSAVINSDFDVIDRVTTNSAGQVTGVQKTSVTIPTATTSIKGLMSATDKANLDAVVADYQSAITALG